MDVRIRTRLRSGTLSEDLKNEGSPFADRRMVRRNNHRRGPRHRWKEEGRLPSTKKEIDAVMPFVDTSCEKLEDEAIPFSRQYQYQYQHQHQHPCHAVTSQSLDVIYERKDEHDEQEEGDNDRNVIIISKFQKEIAASMGLPRTPIRRTKTCASLSELKDALLPSVPHLHSEAQESENGWGFYDEDPQQSNANNLHTVDPASQLWYRTSGQFSGARLEYRRTARTK